MMLEPFSIKYSFEPVEPDDLEMDQIFMDRLSALPGVINISLDQFRSANGFEIAFEHAESTLKKAGDLIRLWKTGFSITYEVITPESAEQGDVESRGYLAKGLTLAQAVKEICSFPFPFDGVEPSDSWIDSARWLTFYGVVERSEGYSKNISLHYPERLNAGTRHKIFKLFDSQEAWEI